MGWRNTSLSRLLGHQEEVKALVVELVLHKVGINDATGLRVLDLTVARLQEHPLIDPLVDHNQRDLDWRCRLVVEGRESFLELCDLLVQDLVSHLLTHTIPVDDDLGWELIFVVLGEVSTSIDQAPV